MGETQPLQTLDIRNVMLPKPYASLDKVALGEGDILFSPGHAASLYALGLIDDSHVFQTQADSGRWGIIKIDKLIQNSHFIQKRETRKQFLKWLDQELIQGAPQGFLENIRYLASVGTPQARDMIEEKKKKLVGTYHRSTTSARSAEQLIAPETVKKFGLDTFVNSDGARYVDLIGEKIDAVLGPKDEKGKRHTPSLEELIAQATSGEKDA